MGFGNAHTTMNTRNALCPHPRQVKSISNKMGQTGSNYTLQQNDTNAFATHFSTALPPFREEAQHSSRPF